MLLTGKRAQPRERGPIIRPTQPPDGVDAAQRLGERRRSSRRIPGQVNVLEVGQQRMHDSHLGQDRNHAASPRLSDHNFSRAPEGC